MRPKNNKTYSIGDVALASDLSVYTLRQWERRYNAPPSTKLSSGHRRYNADEIIRLKLVKKALDLGFKPKDIVPLEYDELFHLIESKKQDLLFTERWTHYLQNWNIKSLQNELLSEWDSSTPSKFLIEKIVPFLNHIGESWSLGQISIAQEHFISEWLLTLISGYWQKNNFPSENSTYILTTLDGEKHLLGLHIAAVILTEHKKNVLFLGGPTPLEEVIQATINIKPQALCLSFSSLFSSQQIEKSILQINKSIPKETSLIIGGKGACLSLANTIQMNNLTQFFNWVKGDLR